MAVCKYCGAVVSDDFTFCAECGRRLVDAKQERETVSEPIVTTTATANTNTNDKIAPISEAKQNEVATKTTENKEVPAAKKVESEPNQSEKADSINVTSTVKVASDEIFDAVMKNKKKLFYDRKTLKEDVTYAYGKKVSGKKFYGLKSNAIPTKYCPYCNEKNQINSEYCTKCGRSLSRLGLLEATNSARFEK